MKKLIILFLCFSFGLNAQSIIDLKSKETIVIKAYSMESVHDSKPKMTETPLRLQDFPMKVRNNSMEKLVITSSEIVEVNVVKLNSKKEILTSATYGGKKVTIPYVLNGEYLLINVTKP